MSLYVAFGGGVNSTGMLIGLLDRGYIPSWVVFADTGGETPETYTNCVRVAKLLKRRRLDVWHWLTKDSMYETLEDECLRNNTIPALAFGFRTCSDKWKQAPQKKFLNNDATAIHLLECGEKIIKAIGFGVDELWRVTPYEDDKTRNWYPLVDWRWNRADCKEAIQREGLPIPPKSSCFFCPSMKKWEVVRLQRQNPDLYKRAIAMERNANLTTIKGLGRSFSWEKLIGPETVEQTCMCFDGEENC